MANLFSTLATVIGAAGKGVKDEQDSQRKEREQALADARANRQLAIMQQEADTARQNAAVNAQTAQSEADYRALEEKALQRKQDEEDQSLPALRARLLQLNPHLDKNLVNQMGYEAINGELNRATQEHDVILAHQLNVSQQLSMERARQQAANAQFLQASRMWTQALSTLKNDIPFNISMAKQGLMPNSPGYIQAARQYLAQKNGMDLYANYVAAAQMAQSTRNELLYMTAGSNATQPAMVDRALDSQMPFEAMTPQQQQQQVQEAQQAAAKGLPVDNYVARGVPVQTAATPSAVTAAGGGSAAAPPGPGFFQSLLNGDLGAAAKDVGGLFSGSAPMIPTAMMPPTPGSNPMPLAPFPAIPPSAPVGPSPVNPAPLFSMPPAVVSPPAAPVLPNGPFPALGPGEGATIGAQPTGMVPAGLPGVPPTLPVPAGAPSMVNNGAPLRFLTPSRPLFDRAAGPGVGATIGPTPGPMASSEAPAPPPIGGGLFDAQQPLRPVRINAPAPTNIGPMGPTLPTMNITAPMSASPTMAGVNTSQTLGQLRKAISAPQAEQLARSLLEAGMNYDMVVGSIPTPFQSLVGAKLPKRISAPLFNQ